MTLIFPQTIDNYVWFHNCVWSARSLACATLGRCTHLFLDLNPLRNCKWRLEGHPPESLTSLPLSIPSQGWEKQLTCEPHFLYTRLHCLGKHVVYFFFFFFFASLQEGISYFPDNSTQFQFWNSVQENLIFCNHEKAKPASVSFSLEPRAGLDNVISFRL